MGEVRFSGELRAAGRGGHVVVVDEDLAASIGARHQTRVHGTFGGVGFRSNLVKMNGTLYLGVHKSTLETAGVAIGDVADITMSLDIEPQPGDRSG